MNLKKTIYRNKDRSLHGKVLELQRHFQLSETICNYLARLSEEVSVPLSKCSVSAARFALTDAWWWWCTPDLNDSLSSGASRTSPNDSLIPDWPGWESHRPPHYSGPTRPETESGGKYGCGPLYCIGVTPQQWHAFSGAGLRQAPPALNAASVCPVCFQLIAWSSNKLVMMYGQRRWPLPKEILCRPKLAEGQVFINLNISEPLWFQMCGSVCAKDGSWEPCNYYITPERGNFRSGDGSHPTLLCLGFLGELSSRWVIKQPGLPSHWRLIVSVLRPFSESPWFGSPWLVCLH